MVVYSHSRLSTFEQCPLKFKFRYIDKLTPEIKQTIEGFLGNKVHDVLEWVYINAINHNIIPLDQAIEFYLRKWKSEFTSDIKINNNLKEEDYLNKGIKFLIDYYTENYPFTDNTIAVERLVTISLDEQGKYIIQGYIDRLVHNKDTNIFEVHDYKTGQIKTQGELDKDRQLALYSLGIKQSFPDVKDVDLVWHFLDFNKKMSSKRTDEELNKLKQDIIALINKIELTTDFPANPSCLCRWCEFRGYCEKGKAFDTNQDSCRSRSNSEE